MNHNLDYLKTEFLGLKRLDRPVNFENLKNVLSLIKWLSTNVGELDPSWGDSCVIFSGDKWRIVNHESSIEGIYESRYELELDRDNDSMLYMLRWA